MDFTIATVAYADVFDFPLTKEECTRWLIKTSRPNFKHVHYKNGFYFLYGRSKIINLRKNKQQWQNEKWYIAKKACWILSHIPMIRLIGVTGGLAMNNADQFDDIDLYIIVRRGSLWLTRLIASLALDVFGLRRHPKETNVTNKICLNMFTTNLIVSKHEQDLFSAHEVLQMEPIVNKQDTYKKFLHANMWVRTYLPNAWRFRNDN